MIDVDDRVPAAWHVADLQTDQSWRFALDDTATAHLAKIVKQAYDPARSLFDYSREEFDLGPARETIASAMQEALHGRGLAMIHGLPREDLSEQEFELLNWAIGLHTGVARPQGRATQYISAVRNVGTDYRSAAGRGFSSNARLDFHADGADLAEIAHQDFYFSRQQEETEDETPAYGQPLFDTCDGRIFGKWNRNRVQSAQNIDGVPRLTDRQRETMDKMDEILSRPDVMFTMYLAPGDMQVINNHVLLHSRTDFEDFEEPQRRRLLHRLWLAPPDSVRLPLSWWDFYRSTEPGTVRGGIRGHNHDAERQAYERRQAAALGMPPPAYPAKPSAG